MNALPRRALSDVDLNHYAFKVMKIPYFRGVFMRDTLPAPGPHHNESAIINLDSIHGMGTHWVAYKKHGSLVNYYDSFGDLPPPKELIHYLNRGSRGTVKILYNYDRHQNFNTVWCGHLCLKFLSRNESEYNT